MIAATLDQWTTFLGAVAGVIAAFASLRAASHSKATRHEVTPPSNGRTSGALLESVVNAATTAATEATRVRQQVTGDLSAAPPPVIPDAETIVAPAASDVPAQGISPAPPAPPTA